MDSFQLRCIAGIILLCVIAARGLDRLIVDPPLPPTRPSTASTMFSTPRTPMAAAPATTARSNFGDFPEQQISVDPDGHYYADAEINGWQLKHMLIDTGATYVALSYDDAASLGVYPGPEDYKYESRTANGVAHVASVTLREVRLGDIVVDNVQAVVAERGALDVSLLGMSFLSRLSRVEATENALALRR